TLNNGHTLPHETDSEMQIKRPVPALLVAVLMATCIPSASPAAPTPTAPTPPLPTTVTVTGHVQATNGTRALANVAVALDDQTTTTDAAGTFSARLPPASKVQLRLTGGIVPRELRIAADAAGDVELDAIALSSDFDLTFYRQLVRNGFDA